MTWTKNRLGRSMLFKDGPHGLAIHELLICRALEFIGKVDSPGDDTCNIRTAAEFGNFFWVEWFPAHSAFLSVLTSTEHYYTKAVPRMLCLLNGVLTETGHVH